MTSCLHFVNTNVDFAKNSLTHGFDRKDRPYNLKDNPGNRNLVRGIANKPNPYGPDSNGNYWQDGYVKIEIEVQIWVRIRNNSITNFGANPPGKYYYWDPEFNTWLPKNR